MTWLRWLSAASICCLLVLSAVIGLHFTVLCSGNECNVFHYLDFLLSEHQLLVYHYRCRSFEDFMDLRLGKSYDARIAAFSKTTFHIAQNESKKDMLERLFLSREAGTTYFDNSALRFLPSLQNMLKITEQQKLFPPKPYCISGYLKPGEAECRSFFLTAWVFVQPGERIYFDEWINTHLAVGVDYFVIYSPEEDRSLFSRYTKPGLAEVRNKFCPPEDCWISLTNISTFWMMHIDMDELLLPPRGAGSLRNYLLPFTSLVGRTVKQIRCMSKSFGSSGWKQRPGMPMLQAYVHRQRILETNGKSVALQDAIDRKHYATGVPYPHSFSLMPQFADDTAAWTWDFGYVVLWMPLWSRKLVVSYPASRPVPMLEGVLLFATYGALVLLFLGIFCRARLSAAAS